MSSPIKQILDEYHHHQTEKAIMKIIVPFFIVVFIVIGWIIFTPIIQELYHAKTTISQISGDYNALNDKYDKLVLKSEYQEDSIRKLAANMKQMEGVIAEQEKGIKEKDHLLKEKDSNYNQLVTEHQQTLSSLDSIKSLKEKLFVQLQKTDAALTFYALLYTPADKPLPAPIFMNLKSDDFQSTFNKQVEEPSVDPARVNISPRKVQKSERSKMGLFIALLSGGGTALLMFIILYARKWHNNSDYRLTC